MADTNARTQIVRFTNQALPAIPGGSAFALHPATMPEHSPPLDVSLLWETLPDACILTSTSGTVVAWNGAAERLFGFAAAEAVGRKIVDVLVVVTPLDDEAVDRGIARGAAVDHGLFHVRRKDGSVIGVRTSTRPVHDERGDVRWLLGVSRHADERRPELDEARFRGLLDASEDGIYELDLEGRCTFTNRAGVRLLGYAEESELVGQQMHDLAHAPREDGTLVTREACPIYRSFVEGRSVHTSTERFRRRDGTVFPAEVWAYPVTRRGAVVGSVVTFMDITQRKLDDAARSKLEEHLRHSERLATVGTLAAGIAHEINNPLSAVLANLAFIGGIIGRDNEARDREDFVEIPSALADARDGAERIRAIVQDMKLLARREDGAVRTVPVAECIEVALKLALTRFKHDVRVVRDYRTHSAALANAARLTQVILNLVVNACQAMTSAKQGQTLTLRAVDDGAAHVVISVEDDGPGIPPEHLTRLFEPFFTTKPEGEGTGLGLAISRSIIAALGGELSVESSPGQGARFRILLPRAAGSPSAPELPDKMS